MPKSVEDRLKILEARIEALQSVLMSLAASTEMLVPGVLEETRQFADTQTQDILKGKHPVATVYINAMLDDLSGLDFGPK